MPDRHGKYSYFDTPDGQDGPKKAWYISKNLATLGVFSGTVDALVVTAPKTKMGVLAVYAKHIGILVGSGLAFTSATYISTDLRKKDLPTNHVVGAIAASAVYGAAVGNPWTFGGLALVSSILAHENKSAQMNGHSLWKLHEQSRLWRREYSIDYHTFEGIRKKDSLKQRYEEKNEEFWQKHRESKV